MDTPHQHFRGAADSMVPEEGRRLMAPFGCVVLNQPGLARADGKSLLGFGDRVELHLIGPNAGPARAGFELEPRFVRRELEISAELRLKALFESIGGPRDEFVDAG